ncbi:hypothetical protein EV175_006447, partial [Coemansia sp. RSA 1933]
ARAIITLLEPIHSAYPESYEFAKDNIYYDAKANPNNHLKAYYQLIWICKKEKVKTKQCFPLQTSWVLGHMQIDTKILCEKFMSGKLWDQKIDPELIWRAVLNYNAKLFKVRANSKFAKSIIMDGVSLSVLRKVWQELPEEQLQQDDCPYIEDIPSSELAGTAGHCVLIDPGQHDLLFCMKKTSSPEQPEVYCYTLNQKAKETCTRQFSKIREVAKKRYPDADVQAAENRLAGFCQTTVDPAKYQAYVEAQRAEWQMLSTFYAWMRTIHPKLSHPIHKELKHIKCKKPKQAHKPQSHPLHCKLCLSAYINQKQADAHLVQNLCGKFGEDAVLVMGNWLAPMTKFHKLIRGKGMHMMLQQQGFKVYLLDEYHTSKTCPACIKGSLTTFKHIKNPWLYQRNARPQVICHGLLSCKNEKCMELMANGSAASPHHVHLWNRDLAAVLNFRHILNGLHENGARPAWFMCSAPKDDDDNKPLLKRLLKATNIEAAKHQRKGQAQPQP